jgi:hypothetical protein
MTQNSVWDGGGGGLAIPIPTKERRSELSPSL